MWALTCFRLVGVAHVPRTSSRGLLISATFYTGSRPSWRRSSGHRLESFSSNPRVVRGCIAVAKREQRGKGMMGAK